MFRFHLPEEVPKMGMAPVLTEDEQQDERMAKWIMVYGNRNGEINFKQSKIIEQGAYGVAFLPPDSNYVVKYMIMRKDERVVKRPEETYQEVFIRDVLRESTIQ